VLASEREREGEKACGNVCEKERKRERERESGGKDREYRSRIKELNQQSTLTGWRLIYLFY
jgi:hypothetical protein